MDLIDDESGQTGPGSNAPEYSVSEISGAIRKTLEDAFGRIRVRGEVGRVFRARSGHLYFDIKDDRSVLASVSWKGQLSSLTVLPEEGMEIVATGRLTTFGSQSKYQLNVEQIEPAGAGALMALLEKRKKQLEAEGLFAPERKRQLPFLPEVIGVVTSPSGAVIRDILHRLRDRFPRKVLVWPVAVQGRDCAAQVAAAIKGFNSLAPGGALPRPDVLIVARGGGSIEDLWGFNEEIVARAAAASQIPLISAVGHETDTTLIDYVSDRRAPTPTAAAEIAVPVRLDLLAHIEGQGARLSSALARGMSRRGERLRDLSRALPRAEALLSGPRQRLDHASRTLPAALRSGVQARHIEFARRASLFRPQVLFDRLGLARERLAARADRLGPALNRRAERARGRFDSAARVVTPVPVRHRIGRERRTLDALSARLAVAALSQQRRRRDKLAAFARILQSLNYEETLKRGFVVVRGDGEVVTDRAAAERARALELQFHDGRLKIGGVAKQTRAKDTPDQGSLF
ncbi:exodeoxyribonuclease VII large subunit [Tropicimonas isoalkanivorans]|uniref:Exodeoxyribonuclease 7 large subunit n=1 Tax=Tropicimonas isoalkanivorans TaxID=441112 RepID=A0A1I1NKK2_9RHOB|nr:exodeoxyribonuclease VII large subunit [Tropicimonas isoalkanivorans]SFC98169.1 Exodeoxyribonuclease VII large subunit [Tropicimonas isoalkanivorans]